ncbi:LacI family DNA-binding transcriptional regulator [Streptomyces sp. TRM49041]|uniref:LacI family DNA-binding transcriptional regulator n=1 Tax=Streptomyces sp. TRM49041 TaxID=2603216 RepID=UPI00292A3E90|nr:LacI family DNA-binding transcriptional regulator [Streptomyces sp. TRM49041]
MTEVARAAGVSIATVSYVVNGTRPVGEETRRKVEEAIVRTGYTPNTLARALAMSRTSSIGVVVSAITNPFFAGVLAGVDQAAVSAGLTVLLADSHDEPEREFEVVRSLRQRRVDGIILAASVSPGRTLDHLRASEMPTVLVDRLVDDRFDQIGPENEEATVSLVGHFATLGHSRIALISGRAGLGTSRERLAGYRLGLARNGLDYHPSLVAEGNSDIPGGHAALERLLAADAPPTALIVGNNAMVIGAMQALRKAGLSIPDDMALASYDDLPGADLFDPPLTAFAQPCDTLGERAVQLLLDRLAHPDAKPRVERLEPRLMHRRSCGCPPRPGTDTQAPSVSPRDEEPSP